MPRYARGAVRFFAFKTIEDDLLEGVSRMVAVPGSSSESSPTALGPLRSADCHSPAISADQIPVQRQSAVVRRARRGSTKRMPIEEGDRN